MADLGTWPSTIEASSCRLVMETNQIVTASPFGGNEQAVDRMNDRWLASVTLPVNSYATAQKVEAFLASFRGQVNWVKLWHLARPAPLGTMRGSRVLQADAVQGADELRITAPEGNTILAGDLLGVGGLLFMAAANATANASNLLIVPLVNRVRVTQAAGGAVVWDKPTAAFRLLSHSGVNYVPGMGEGVTLELREAVL